MRRMSWEHELCIWQPSQLDFLSPAVSWPVIFCLSTHVKPSQRNSGRSTMLSHHLADWTTQEYQDRYIAFTYTQNSLYFSSGALPFFIYFALTQRPMFSTALNEAIHPYAGGLSLRASHAESLGFQTLRHPVREGGPQCWAMGREVKVLLVWADEMCLNAFEGESRGVPQSYREVCGLLFPALGSPSGFFNLV